MSDTLKQWLTVDNLVKLLVAILFTVGTYLWNDINSKIANLENSIKVIPGQEAIADIRRQLDVNASAVASVRTDFVQGDVEVERGVRDDLNRGLDRLNSHSHPEDPRLTTISRELGTIVSQLENIDDDLGTISVDVRRLDIQEVPEVERQVVRVQSDVQELTEAVREVGSRVNARGVITNTGMVSTPTSDGSFPTAPSIPGTE